MDFKDLLRNEIEKKQKDKLRYFARDDLLDILPKCRPDTINRYLVNFGKEGIIFGAGRGWYLFVKESFELDRRPVKKIITTLEKNIRFFLSLLGQPSN